MAKKTTGQIPEQTVAPVDKTVDNTRSLAPMTDPIAYRKSYDQNNIRS